MLRAATFWGSGIDLHETGHLQHRRRFDVGPFAITPYLADHSAFDAYSLLVEAGSRRLFYSGDVRGHGRKHRAFDWLLDDPPSDIDVMLLEGTNIRAGDTDASAEALPSEADVEDDLLATLKATTGLVVVLSSAQNIDRLVTVYRATKRAGQHLGIDLYTHEISVATSRDTIPRVGPDWPLVSAYLPIGQRVKVKKSQEFGRVDEVRGFRVFDEKLAADPGWMGALRCLSVAPPAPAHDRAAHWWGGGVVAVGRLPRPARRDEDAEVARDGRGPARAPPHLGPCLRRRSASPRRRHLTCAARPHPHRGARSLHPSVGSIHRRSLGRRLVGGIGGGHR